jgi:hypothetical protein
MDKKRLHHVFTRLRPISPWYFLILSLIASGISINALRNNNLMMIKLRDQVTVADTKNGDTETALRNLRVFIYGHMNTNLTSGADPIKPPIQLKFQYNRLVKAEADRVAAANTKLYSDAEAICQQAIPVGFSGGVRVPCITDYVTTHAVTARTIPVSLYQFDFLSPSWSPDLAGWSIVVAIMSFLAFVILFTLERWLKAELRT